jgi:outer membrane protein assembly factor BamB
MVQSLRPTRRCFNQASLTILPEGVPMPSSRACLSLLVLFGLSLPSATAQEWTRFRGPNGSGVSEATTVPSSWTDKDFTWKVALPGKGYSSPVLWGAKVFLTAGDRKTGKRIVLCLDADSGRTLWTKELDAKSYAMHQRNSVATATPTVDAGRVYLTWATPSRLTAMALDHDGKLVWEVDLGPFKSQHGFGVSPILHDGMLILANDQDNGGSLIALDAATGKERWKMPRKSKNATYATPCIYQTGTRPAELILTNWQLGISAVNPKNGRNTWEISVFDRTRNERAIGSPVVAGDLILGSCGFTTAQKHLVAVKPDADGKPKEVWRLERGVPHMSTPLVKDGMVFLCNDQGLVTCLEAATGKQLWQERVDGSFSASPVCAGDRLYLVANDGTVHVLKAGAKFERLGGGVLGEATQSTPAIARGRMYLRTESHLICIGGKK